MKSSSGPRNQKPNPGSRSNKSRVVEQFEKKMLNHMDSAYNLARFISGHDQDAEDIVQEAYIKAFRSFEKNAEINSLSWLLTIVRNTSYNWLKSKHVRKDQVEFDETMHSAKLGPLTLPDGTWYRGMKGSLIPETTRNFSTTRLKICRVMTSTGDIFRGN